MDIFTSVTLLLVFLMAFKSRKLSQFNLEGRGKMTKIGDKSIQVFVFYGHFYKYLHINRSTIMPCSKDINTAGAVR